MPKSIKVRDEIYLDYASATPIDKEVSKAMALSFGKYFSNPSAIHHGGVKVKNILEQARTDVAEILQAHSDEIIFTSGATESNNLAIKGVLDAEQNESFLRSSDSRVPIPARPFKNSHFVPHIVTTNIEHASILEVCKYLEEKKLARITYVRVEKNGIVDSKKIKKALTRDTVLVSVMYANNEIGTIQSIREIAKEIRHFQKNKKNTIKKIIFHTDATQAVNYLPINVLKLGVDLMSLNAGKIYGPKGVGVLFKKRNVSLESVMHGGNQEFGLRAGTENLPVVLGLAEALKITEKLKEKETKRLTKLRDYFLSKLEHSNILKNVGMFVNGEMENRLPNNMNVTIPKIPSDLLVIELSARGIMASAKSACKSGDGKASHVIEAIRPSAKPAQNASHSDAGGEVDGAIRFSLGRGTTKSDIDYTVKSLNEILTKLWKWYN